jgi:phosphopantetheinyl transferase
MQICIASIDEAYSLVPTLDKVWTDFAKRFGENRAKTFLAGRALLQKILHDFYQIEKLPFMRTLDNGKPIFEEARFPFFNISHSARTICIAVGSKNLGVDIEFIKKRVHFDALTHKVLSKLELSYLDTLDEEKKLEFFTALWTVRECLVKITGRGLVDLSQITINLETCKIKYYNAEKDNTIHTLRLDDLITTEKPSFLSYSKDKNEEAHYFLLDKGRLNPIHDAKDYLVFNT